MKKWGFLIVVVALVAGALTLPRFAHAPGFLHELTEKFSPKKPIVLGFGGDLMFDRYIRQKDSATNFSRVLANLTTLFAPYDAGIANLEGSITVFDSVSVGSTPLSQNNYVFTFPPQTARALADAHITVVNLGNNHSFNFGNGGLSQTKQFLSEAGVFYFGEPFAEGTLLKDFDGTHIAFLNFNEFLPPGVDETIETISRLAQENDFVVVFPHWGYEYEKRANDFQKDLAHRFIDAGADFVAGSHPHVIQEHEVYKGKDIYYSLGNLLFDQYWNEDVRCGLVVTLTLNPKDFSYTTATTTVYMESDGTTTVRACSTGV